MYYSHYEQITKSNKAEPGKGDQQSVCGAALSCLMQEQKHPVSPMGPKWHEDTRGWLLSVPVSYNRILNWPVFKMITCDENRSLMESWLTQFPEVFLSGMCQRCWLSDKEKYELLWYFLSNIYTLICMQGTFYSFCCCFLDGSMLVIIWFLQLFTQI